MNELSTSGKISFEQLNASRNNITSQNGENGLIEFIATIIGCDKKTCVEFGAWDGKHLSNVYPLWHNKEWQALLIEANLKKFEELVSNTKGYDVTPLQAFVGDSGENKLEQLAEKACFPMEWDVLSIDIDGNDYAILESIDFSRIKIRLVIVEFNNSIPPHVSYMRKGNNYTGSSALAFVKLMKARDYEPLCTCGANLFFISKEDFDNNFGYDNNLNIIFDYSNISYLMSDFAGNLICNRLPNHTRKATGFWAGIRSLARWIKHPVTRKDPYNGSTQIRTIQIYQDDNSQQ
jgi:hypothetical protein